MARKVINMAKTGPWAQRWAVLLSLVVIVATGLILIQTLFAVHKDGFFELDGNVHNQTDPADCSFPAAAGCGEDWEDIADGSTTASATTGIIPDPQEPEDTSIFTTGGSKDDLDVSQWRWTEGSVPDKDELLNAYAARYADNVYFGTDRYITNGTAQIGFWFFQNAITPNANGTFDGLHEDGDILILADFTNGGAAVKVQIFQWELGGPINGTLRRIRGEEGGVAADCRDPLLGDSDEFCATTNPAAIPLNGLWEYEPKPGPNSEPNTIPIGGFFEGGIDLEALGLADKCFASFLAETRSSASVDATLKDHVLHTFEPCVTRTETTPSDATGNPLATDSDGDGLKEVFLGDFVRDYAKVFGTGSNQAPLGKVIFHICSPTELDANGVCSTGGTLVGNAAGEDLVPIANETNSEVTSAQFQIPVASSSIGKWCWRGDYQGNAEQGFPPSSDFSARECFEVIQLATAITTAQTWTLRDSATITVPAGTLAGSLKFELWVNDAACNGSPVQTTIKAISGASGQFDTSDTLTVTLPQGSTTYSWKVTYTSTNPAHAGVTSACNTENSTLAFTNGS